MAGVDVPALAASGVALLVALLTAGFQLWTYLDAKRAQRTKVALQYKVPLVMAADELSSRISNLVENNLGSYFIHGLPRQKQYVCENTIYLVCQYFAWQQAVSCRLPDLNLDEKELGALIRLVSDVRNAFSTDALRSMVSHLFGGEQRAIGEQLLVVKEDGSFSCMTYSQFLKNQELSEYVQPLREPVKMFIAARNRGREPYAEAVKRLVAVRQGLEALTEFLDSGHAHHKHLRSWTPSYMTSEQEIQSNQDLRLTREDLEEVGIGAAEVDGHWLRDPYINVL